MGGPNFSIEMDKRVKFMKENREIDFYVINEGEIAACEIIKRFIEHKSIEEVKKSGVPSSISIIKDLVFYSNSEKTNRLPADRYNNIPSPYLSGAFDVFFKDSYIPLIETNRGCPFTCSFCQQGDSYNSKIVNFSIEKTVQEIEYIAKKIHNEKIKSYVLEIADSNFAMYKKDLEVTKAIRNIQDKYNYPLSIESSTGKNKTKMILDNLAQLKENSIQIRLALQSMNDKTLSAIKRKNINIENYKSIQKYQFEKNIHSITDMMLGLPEETYETHSNSLYELINLQINEFSLVQTIVLHGTELETEEYKKKYKIITKHRPIQECIGEYDILNEKIKVCETEQIIIQTNTMSGDDYYNLRKLHLIIVMFHNTNILSPVYAFLKEFCIKPSDLIKTILNSKNKNLIKLLNNFIEDTKLELFDSSKEITSNKDIEKYTYNKIFKHLAIAFFKNKDVILNVLEESINCLTKNEKKSSVEELCDIVEKTMISPFNELKIFDIVIKDEILKKLYGEKITIKYTEKQKKLINLFNEKYSSPEDKINKMVYHLRPTNLCLNIEKNG